MDLLGQIKHYCGDNYKKFGIQRKKLDELSFQSDDLLEVLDYYDPIPVSLPK